MMTWAIIGILMAVVGFVSNKLVNTNCLYVYSGSMVVGLGALVGMSGRPVIAASIVVFGCILSIQGSIIMHKKHRERDLNIN